LLIALFFFPSTAELRKSTRPASFPVHIQIDMTKTRGAVRPVSRFFGADEPNYAYMKNGRKLIAELGQLAPTRVYFRTHNLLSSGDGTPALKWGSTGVYSENANGKPIYDWTILDRIFDTYLKNGVRPYVEIGFMPRDLSIKPEPYQHKWTSTAKYEEIFTGWAYPPKDYSKWAALVHAWAKHCVQRYGRKEVEQWYWEVWNEANIPYWRGTPEDFRKLHDYAIAAVRTALPTARVGGPDTAGPGGQFMRDFLEHCLRGQNYATGKVGTPLDFISFHAKGSPKIVDGHVQMGISAQLRNIDSGFEIVASYPQLKNKPIIIGESDPEGCAACQGPQLAYRNGTMYSSYTAACFARKQELADRHGINFEGALTWAFEFEDQPYFAGFRALATNGLDLPVLNVFRMFARMKGQRLETQSDTAVTLNEMLKDGVRGKPDVSAVASITRSKLYVMVWHYHDDDVPGPDANVELELTNLPFMRGVLTEFRIDNEHSNSFAEWQRMGSPTAPTPAQYEALERAGQLTVMGTSKTIAVRNGEVSISISLPRQAVSLIEIDWHGSIPRGGYAPKPRVASTLGNGAGFTNPD
jgi:xylan 1,4-beta-xylosidase